MPNTQTLGARVRALRLGKGWTLDQLAQEAKVSKGFLSTVEKGDSQPSGRVLLGLAKALGASVDYLVQGDASAPPARPAPLAIPDELAALAEQKGWSFRKVRAVLEAQQAIIARRSERTPRPFTTTQWLEFAERLDPYLEPGDE
ncbi:MAG: helix-turn-helix domain-containing protein [Polyangiaceae bacterium]|nr:helix-turn-helix domain-containing protein [Polyangiaceae bacterium]